MRYRFRCHTMRFGFLAVRSTFVVSASSHTTAAASSGSGLGPIAGANAPSRRGVTYRVAVTVRSIARSVGPCDVRSRRIPLQMQLPWHHAGDGTATPTPIEASMDPRTRAALDRGQLIDLTTTG